MSKAQTVADAFYEEECRGVGGESATTFDAGAILDRAVSAAVTVDVVSVSGKIPLLPHTSHSHTIPL